MAVRGGLLLGRFDRVSCVWGCCGWSRRGCGLGRVRVRRGFAVMGIGRRGHEGRSGPGCWAPWVPGRGLGMPSGGILAVISGE